MKDSLCPNEHTITLDPDTQTLTITCGDSPLGSLVGARDDDIAQFWQQLTMMRHQRDLLEEYVERLEAAGDDLAKKAGQRGAQSGEQTKVAVARWVEVRYG